MIKTFLEMNNRELFCVLTGDKGIIQQMHLQNIVRDYLKVHHEDTDLETMVRWAAERKEET